MAKPISHVRKLTRGDLDALSEGLVWQDADGRIIDANASAAPILGLTQDELLGRTPHDPRWYAVHEDGSPWPGQEHPGMVALRTGVPQRNQLMGIMAPGAGRRWIRIDATPQRKAGVSAPAGVLASFFDVTDEVEMRHRLQEEASRLGALRAPRDAAAAASIRGATSTRGRHTAHPGAEARSDTPRSAGAKAAAGASALRQVQAHLDRVQAVARIGSFTLGSDRDRFSYTRETARLFDLDEHGQADFALWFSRVHPEDRAAVRAAWEAALQGAPYDMTYRIVARDQVTWIRARADLEFDAQHRLQSAVGTVQDISDLKSAELELDRSRQRLQLAIEASALGTWDYDLRTGQVQRDARFLEMLGYAPGQLDPDYASFTRLVHPDDLAAVEAAAAAHFRGESAIYETEHRLRHREGHHVWVLSVGKVVERDADSRPLRIIGTNRDISQHKRLTEGSIGLLRHIEKLIAAINPGRPTADAGPGASAVLDRLTKRERQVAGLIAMGLSSAQIGQRLRVAVPTVVSHRRNLMAKLKLHSAAEVTRFAIEHGLPKVD